MRIRRHLTYANVTATLALFLALGGAAYAIDRVHSREIANGTIKSVDLKNRKAVRAQTCNADGLTGRQINENTLDSREPWSDRRRRRRATAIRLRAADSRDA